MERLADTSDSEVSSLDAPIPFNKPSLAGQELEFIAEAVNNGWLSGNGHFTHKCHGWLESMSGAAKSFLTHSGTAALEMASLLADIQPGDEVIMPSFTFVTTASSFALRGGIPVYVDIHPDTLNLNEALIEKAISKKTKAIVPVHYAGMSCQMEAICRIAREAELLVIEDAAHGILAKWKGRPVGSWGDMSALSFHETKNIVAGECGALLINNPDLVERAHVVWEKGTNRREFVLGYSDKYTWKDIGSSFPPSELTAAFLWAQMRRAEEITGRRVEIWKQYHDGYRDLEDSGLVQRPVIPEDSEINGHIYYLLLPSQKKRDELIQYLRERGISAPFHYVPLHSSPAGLRYGKTAGTMEVTNRVSESLIRMPLWPALSDAQVQTIVSKVRSFFGFNS